MKQFDEIITPDGYQALVLLCAGANVLVYLMFAHVPDRMRVYPKAELT